MIVSYSVHTDSIRVAHLSTLRVFTGFNRPSGVSCCSYEVFLSVWCPESSLTFAWSHPMTQRTGGAGWDSTWHDWCGAWAPSVFLVSLIFKNSVDFSFFPLTLHSNLMDTMFLYGMATRFCLKDWLYAINEPYLRSKQEISGGNKVSCSLTVVLLLYVGQPILHVT